MILQHPLSFATNLSARLNDSQKELRTEKVNRLFFRHPFLNIVNLI